MCLEIQVVSHADKLRFGTKIRKEDMIPIFKKE